MVEIKLFVFIYLEFFPKNLGSGGRFLIYFIQCISCSISPSVFQVTNFAEPPMSAKRSPQGSGKDPKTLRPLPSPTLGDCRPGVQEHPPPLAPSPTGHFEPPFLKPPSSLRSGSHAGLSFLHRLPGLCFLWVFSSFP